jgi:hypothetical protein
MEKKQQALIEKRLEQKTNGVIEVLKGSSYNEIEWILQRVKIKIEGSKGILSFS